MNSNHTPSEALNQLEIDHLAEFDATLGELPDPDKKQRRILYLRDATQKMGSGKSFSESFGSFFKGMGLYLMPLAIIFLLLPLFFAAWFRKIRDRILVNHRLTRALDYWHIDRCEIA
jgi:hypothetical protein